MDIDTEFPGVVARPRNSFKHWLGYGYRLVADNVNMLKLIQLGLTFFNEKGETPRPISTLQFNFRFNVERDMFAPDSVELLIRSGIDFAVLQKEGIEHAVFAEVATMSGLVLNDDVRWICFHGAYDFGYLVKTLCSRNLPKKEADFFYLLHKYFPSVYDLKVCCIRPIPHIVHRPMPSLHHRSSFGTCTVSKGADCSLWPMRWEWTEWAGITRPGPTRC